MHQVEDINLTAKVTIDSAATALKNYLNVNDYSPANPGFHRGEAKTR